MHSNDICTHIYVAAAAKSLEKSEVAQSCPILCDPMDCSLSVFSVHGIFQARILEWVPISFSRSSWPRDGTPVFIAGRCFTGWATREVLLLLLLTRISLVRLCATPWTAAHQAPPSTEFSRQEYCSGLPLPSPGSPRKGLFLSCD